MPAPSEAPLVQVQAHPAGDTLTLHLRGRWHITQPIPAWEEVIGSEDPAHVRFDASELDAWDSSLVLFIATVQGWCEGRGASCDVSGLPKPVRDLVSRLHDAHRQKPGPEHAVGVLTAVGLAATSSWKRARAFSSFVGECVLSAARLVRKPQKFRWRDCIHEMQQCGAMALPITGLIAFLVGVTLAYTGAIILRQFGGDIWVADLIGLSMTREMGAVMTGIVLAGRTGAAFAAEIGNMKAGEELDALETLGIRAVDFLVIPRIVALVLMMPLLVLYANALGIIGGMVIALFLLNIPPAAYWVEMLTIVDMSDLMTGLIKAVTFGGIVGLAGCLRGLQAERSAVGVGQAATSAVVTSILLIVVADAIFAVLFNILGW